jgi:renal tumor antigen
VRNLPEIQALRRLGKSANIVHMIEVLYDEPSGRLALVFELMERNVYDLLKHRREYLATSRVRNYIYQLLKALDLMHRRGIMHRDIKPENILVSGDVLKLADFGSCAGVSRSRPQRTPYIATRWYRAPEMLLTDGFYTEKVDCWAVGCVFFEMVSCFPLFPGTGHLDMINRIHAFLGTPTASVLANIRRNSSTQVRNGRQVGPQVHGPTPAFRSCVPTGMHGPTSCIVWANLTPFSLQADSVPFDFAESPGTGFASLIPHVPEVAIDLMTRLLAYNPDERISAKDALMHTYFHHVRHADQQAGAVSAHASETVTQQQASQTQRASEQMWTSTPSLGTAHEGATAAPAAAPPADSVDALVHEQIKSARAVSRVDEEAYHYYGRPQQPQHSQPIERQVRKTPSWPRGWANGFSLF